MEILRSPEVVQRLTSSALSACELAHSPRRIRRGPRSLSVRPPELQTCKLPSAISDNPCKCSPSPISRATFQGWVERAPEIERAFATSGQSLIVDDRDPAVALGCGDRARTGCTCSVPVRSSEPGARGLAGQFDFCAGNKLAPLVDPNYRCGEVARDAIQGAVHAQKFARPPRERHRHGVDVRDL